VGVRVWVERSGEAVLGEGRAELLAAIHREHSITKAANAAGMSYRRAWNLIQSINAAAGEPLVAAAVGGTSGGGAKLTPRGRMVLDTYEQVRESLVESAAGALQRTISDSDAVVHLAAAISLQEAVGQILAEHALAQPKSHVRAIFGASNELVDHLLAGAPGDLILSAEPAELDRLDAAKLIMPRTRRPVATNGLAIVAGNRVKFAKKINELLSARIKRVAIAEPACPLGGYSRRYLEDRGIYDKLLPKILHVDNSRAVLAAVVSGAAQVGIAFSSDASRIGPWQTVLRVPTSRAAATYEAALVSRQAKRAVAAGLLDFMTTPTALRCFKRCGLGATTT
jgi:molybdenum ABC transporter molybdate-binding protein